MLLRSLSGFIQILKIFLRRFPWHMLLLLSTYSTKYNLLRNPYLAHSISICIMLSANLVNGWSMGITILSTLENMQDKFSSNLNSSLLVLSISTKRCSDLSWTSTEEDDTFDNLNMELEKRFYLFIESEKLIHQKMKEQKKCKNSLNEVKRS